MNKVDKFLRRLQKHKRIKIYKAIFDIRNCNYGDLKIKRLRGSKSVYRVRVGIIRIIFEKTDFGNKIIDIDYRNNINYDRFKDIK